MHKICEQIALRACLKMVPSFLIMSLLFMSPFTGAGQKSARIECTVTGQATEAEIYYSGENTDLDKECRRVATQFLGYAGYAVVEDAAAVPDLTVRIKMDGEAVGSIYVAVSYTHLTLPTN